jgi:hypothetical protein
MDAKVTVEMMVKLLGVRAGLEASEAHDFRGTQYEAVYLKNHGILVAARDYIIAAESQLAERDAQIAEMRKELGPACPQCGRRLKWHSSDQVLICRYPSYSTTKGFWITDDPACSITSTDLITNYPGIAAELGLTEANDADVR